MNDDPEQKKTKVLNLTLQSRIFKKDMWDNTVAIFRHIEDGSWSTELLCWNYTSECRVFFFARIFVYNILEHLTNEKLHVSLLMLRSKIFPLKYRFVAYNNRAFPLKKMKNLRIVSGLYWSSFRHTLKIYPFFFFWF